MASRAAYFPRRLGCLAACVFWLAACSSEGSGPAGPGKQVTLADSGAGGGSGDSGPVTDASSDASSPGLTCPTTLSELRSQILLPSCATSGCHSSADRAASLDLETTALEPQLLGVESSLCQGQVRIVPGDAAASLFVQKIAGTTSCGAPMPIGAQALAGGTVQCIADLVDSLSLQQTGCETCGGTSCIDLSTSTDHCGTCDQSCGAIGRCEAGTCVCDAGLLSCGGECVDDQTDAQNCGGCGTDCGASFCSAGSCVADCGPLATCGQACIDTQADDRHCGGCGMACGPGTHCQAGQCACGDSNVSFAKDVQPVFTQSCASQGCHASGGGSGGGRGGGPPARGSSSLDLSEGNAYASLLSVTTKCGPVVSPGDPGASGLIGKLTGTQLCNGSQMPKGSPALPDATIDQIAAWICQGAQDN